MKHRLEVQVQLQWLSTRSMLMIHRPLNASHCANVLPQEARAQGQQDPLNQEFEGDTRPMANFDLASMMNAAGQARALAGPDQGTGEGKATAVSSEAHKNVSFVAIACTPLVRNWVKRMMVIMRFLHALHELSCRVLMLASTWASYTASDALSYALSQ
jgi:hypothetical protein